MAVMTTSPPPRVKQLGLPAASALVVGSVIGTGVFGLPTALAAFGPISLVAFVLVTIGALALAIVFGQLTRRVPGSGGPYLYARDAFGEFAGFLNAWSYWLTAWAGNAAIVVALTGYVEVFVNTEHNVGWSIVIAVVCLWIPVLINVLGLRSMGGAQVLFTVLKIVPLALIAILGLFFLNPANLGPFNSSGTDSWTALAGAGARAHQQALSDIGAKVGLLPQNAEDKRRAHAGCRLRLGGVPHGRLKRDAGAVAQFEQRVANLLGALLPVREHHLVGLLVFFGDIE